MTCHPREDQDALFRTDGHAFTPADVPLIDELAEILGVDSEAEREEEERAWQEQLRQAEEALGGAIAAGNFRCCRGRCAENRAPIAR